MSSPAVVAPDESEEQPTTKAGYAAYDSANDAYVDDEGYVDEDYVDEYGAEGYDDAAQGDQPAEAGMAAAPAGVADGAGDALIFKVRYQIFPNQPLPALNSPTAMAFHASLRNDLSRPVMAYVCDPEMPQRFDALESLRAFNLPGMLKPHDWGLIDWPGVEGKRFLLVLDRPMGPRVVGDLISPSPPLTEEEIVRGLLQGTLSTMKDLSARGVAHRAIRPDNLFWTDETRKSMALGDAWTTPPGYSQPPMFETIESMMCDPTGRGPGLPTNDMYALGVTILFLLIGRSPSSTMSDAELLNSKIEFGSYAALVGQYRLPLALTEVLRGLLSDDSKERWSVADIDMWLSGRRLTPKQSKLPQRGSRPFEFGGTEHFNARSLGVSLATNFKDAGPAVKGKALDGWLRRAVGDEAKANAVQEAIASNIGGQAKNVDDRIVARACIALDPAAPIRYRGFGVTIDGLGVALISALANRELRQTISEIITSRLAIGWAAAQGKPSPDEVRIVQVLEKLPAMLENPVAGFGVERAVYELNFGQRCLSPMFSGLIVTEIEHVLPALELAARATDRLEAPMDRHLAGFIAARLRRSNDDLIRPLSSLDSEARNMGTLRLLASIQETESAGAVPALSRWIAELLAPNADTYHHNARRERMAEKLARVSDGGNLSELLMVLDDKSERMADQQGFSQAQMEYRQLESTINEMEMNETERVADARKIGEQVSAAIAGLLLCVVTALVVLAAFGNR
jgi:hypothetical protein